MGFFGNFFRSKRSESVIFIDIGTGSIAGACAQYTENKLPTVLYMRRLPIEIQENEPHERAMLRAFEMLNAILIREGIPVLAHSTGSHTIDAILVSIGSPWQETSVHVEHIAPQTDFVFTKHLVAETIQKVSPRTPGKIFSDATVLATVINGYETHNPYGKRVHHASITILTSLIDQSLNDSLLLNLHNSYHTKCITLIASSSLRYQALCIAFPHERDVLILDVTGPLAAIALVRKSLLVAVSETPKGAILSSGTRINEFMYNFGEIAKQYPLPRVVLLLARDPDVDSVKQVLGTMDFSSLWLSNNPPKIVPILANQLTGFVHQTTTVPPDLPLLLMALYYQYRNPKT